LLESSKPTCRAIVANTSFDARTENTLRGNSRRSNITLFRATVFAADAYIQHLIRFMDSSV
jgi:hypothetical protein